MAMHLERGSTLPPLRPDLLLLHAPAAFEFRDRDDIFFPYMSTSGDVPITPLYEYMPVGFKTLERWLEERGHDVTILNLSTLLLRYPRLDITTVLSALQPRLLGIDLHWMVHVQGALEIAHRFKAVHPEIPVIFGGISSTFYADELIQYPSIDMVMRGYDTHAPMDALLAALRDGRAPRDVANLVWKDAAGEIVDNGMSFLPDTFGCGIDWSTIPHQQAEGSLPILEVLSTQNAGCAYNCHWCGGSREAFRRVFQRKRAMARKPAEEVRREFATMSGIPDQERYHFYAVGSYNETAEGFERFIDHVADSSFKSVSYEQYHLTSDETLRRMAAANPRTSITLSPESSDLRIAKLTGRGVYDMPAMEAWIDRALDLGVYQIDVWFFIGMPEQDEAAVQRDVDYARHLLRRFAGRRVMPYLCPMIPFLDPASTFFERPDEHGYRVFFRSVEEHRVGMTRASLVNRINYETRWLDRRALVDVGYAAVRRLTEAKAEFGQLPSGIAHSVIARMDDAIDFIKVVHAVDEIQEAPVRMRELRSLGSDIRRRNEQVFFGGVANQAFPIDRAVGGRWFDELGWDPAILDDLDPMGASTAQEGSVIGARRAVPFHPAVVSSPTP